MINTSYYAKAKNHPDAIGISRGVPDWFIRPVIIELAPATFALIKTTDREKFTYIFRQQLEKLDVHEYAKKCEGKIILCYETLRGNWCHREIVADWFRENGYECEEWKSEKDLELEAKEAQKSATPVANQSSLF